MENQKEAVIKGLVGSRPVGEEDVVTGVAYVVSDAADPIPELRQVPLNQIIVISKTSPAHTPYLKGSKAMVVDIGGLVSHAVTASRELSIPCIVGTKSATQEFKTGDNLKIDLAKGTVEKV